MQHSAFLISKIMVFHNRKFDELERKNVGKFSMPHSPFLISKIVVFHSKKFDELKSKNVGINRIKWQQNFKEKHSLHQGKNRPKGKTKCRQE
jgi:hypothetical protein